MPACVTRVEEGMDIQTDTPRLREYRRMIVELLLAERNHVCSVCVANGNCELQDLAIALGVDHVRYDYLHPTCEVDLSHPRFGIDHNRCILCTRCVRACDEIEGAHTWDVAGRGTHAACHHRPESALGHLADLHLVRQVPPGLPHRRDLRARARRSPRSDARPRRARLPGHRAGEEAMGRLKLATVWLGGCSGCHMSFLDLDEFLIDLADQADVVYTPIMDVKEYPEGVDVVLVEGAIANEEHLEMIRRVRQRDAGAGLVRRLRGDRQRHRAAQPARLGRARADRGRTSSSADLQPQIPREARDRPAAPGPGDAGPRGRPGRRLPARLPAAGASHPRGAGASPRGRAGASRGAGDQVRLTILRLRFNPNSERRDVKVD